jgi:hypothetical protein
MDRYWSDLGSAFALSLLQRSAIEHRVEVPFNASDPIAWRQWHHWSIVPGITQVRSPAGKTVLTVHILTGGNMNLAYFNFKKSVG